jgi:hypothetical protein
MSAFFYFSASGWIASLLLGVEILLPYLLRPSRVSRSLDIVPRQSGRYLLRMKPHYWLGYVVLGLSTLHAWFPMQAGYMKRANMAGLSFATAALLLIMFQALSGLTLQDVRAPGRAKIRSCHYWTMIAVVLCVGAHIYLSA